MADSEILDQVTKNAPWLMIPATLLTAAPKLLELWQGFTGSRDGRKPLEIEKARLENLKLRIEIEALKKQHGITLPEDEISARRSAPGARMAERSGAVENDPPPKKIWGWLDKLARRWPGMTESAAGGLSIACVWLGLVAVFAFIAGAVAEWSTEPKEAGWYLLGGAILFLFPGWILIKFGSSLKTQRKLLKNGAKVFTAPAASPTK